MKIAIDTEACTGHGRCYTMAPDLFTDDEAGYGEVIGDGMVTKDQRDVAERAVQSCPERAVALVEDESG